jgi:beta-galactosidase
VEYSYPGLINNYGTSIGTLADTIHSRHPDKILFYSEFGYGQLREDLDGDADARGMMDSIRFRPFLIGGALWTFNDYRSSYVGNRAFSENRSWGIVDVFRQKKKAWYSFRKEYTPVRELNVAWDQTDLNSMRVSILPRKLLDLPAYRLKDYTLVWQGFDEQDTLREGGFFKLPVIDPGDDTFEKNIQWQHAAALSYLKIAIISPGNYAVCDTLVCLKKPLPPRIIYTQGVRSDMNDTFPNSGAIRVVFDETKPGITYQVKYGLTGLLQESAVTMNNYIDVSRLPYWKTYNVAVVAINAAGESAVQDIKKVRVEPGLPPPVIAYTEPADRGFYVGYMTEKEDYLFKIQYTQTAGDYSSATTFQTATKGVLFVPGLENGKKYYFRMCRIKHNNYITPWSEEHAVIPDGGQAPATPEVQGALRSGSEAMILFEPVKKAIGYVIEYRLKRSGEWKAIPVNASELRHYKITALKEGATYEFRMASVNECKQSAFVDVKVISK